MYKKITGRQLMNLVLLRDYGVHRCNIKSLHALKRRQLVRLQEGNAPWAFEVTPSGLQTIELHRPTIYGSGYSLNHTFTYAKQEEK